MHGMKSLISTGGSTNAVHSLYQVEKALTPWQQLRLALEVIISKFSVVFLIGRFVHAV